MQYCIRPIEIVPHLVLNKSFGSSFQFSYALPENGGAEKEERIMYVAKGKSRIAFVFPSLGIAAKIPHVRFRVAFSGSNTRTTWWEWMRGGLGMLRINLRRGPHEVVQTLRNGIHANRDEMTYWRKTRYTIPVPTRLSLLGLVNVQEAGTSVRMEPGLFVRAMWQLTEDGIEPHHLSEPRNFSYDPVHGFRVMDYAGTGIQSVLDRYADALRTFVP